MNKLPLWIAAPLVALCMQARATDLPANFACGPQPECLNILPGMSIYSGYGDQTVVIDGKVYTGTVSFASVISVLMVHPVGTLTAEDGSQITIDFTMHDNRFGRRPPYTHHWEMVSGTVVRP